MTSPAIDAVVVGSGPNGLMAAVTLARAGRSVRVYEGASTIGGGTRTLPRTLPGFRHDVCSAVHPLGAGSPALRALPLEEHGLRWIEPEVQFAHPFDDGTAAHLARSVDETVASLGEHGDRYRRLVKPFLGHWDALAAGVMQPVIGTLPRHPLVMARFGLRTLAPASVTIAALGDERTRALFAGVAAHAGSPLTAPLTSAFGLVLMVAGHEVGWPVAAGGSQAIADALVSHLRELGGEVVTDHPVRTMRDLPDARAYLFDTMPESLAAIAGDALPRRYARRLARYKHGVAVFKVDYALDEPVPWRAEACRRATTVHLGPTAGEIEASLHSTNHGAAPTAPYMIVTQPTVVDPSRAPAGKHVLWAYAHVPNGWDGDLTDALDRQIERFAPGFRDCVAARSVSGPARLERSNPNIVGGDIAGGDVRGRQLLARPVLTRVPYSTPNRSLYLCSAATPPGPGVHGMCGYHAATVALRRAF